MKAPVTHKSTQECPLMRKIFVGDTYNGFPLSGSWKNNNGFFVEVLEAIESLLNYMTNRHGSVFFTMFVMKYPADSGLRYPNDNALLSRFIEALTLHCKRRKFDPKYLWVRETSTTGQFHYHFVLLLDSNYTQNAYGIHDKAIELWQRCLGIENGKGLVHLCKTVENYAKYGGIKIKRNDPQLQEVRKKCYELASYLAKCYSKEGLPPYVNGFGCSRLN
jgi:hypothetical protein